MTEETNNTETIQTPAEGTGEPTPTEDLIPKSRFDGVLEEVRKRDEKLKAYEAKEAEASKLAEAAALQKNLEQDKHMEVIEGLQAKLKEQEQAIAAKDFDMKRGSLERRLMDEGIKDKYKRRGMIDDFLEGDNEDVDTWIDAVKKESPDSFKPDSKSMSTGPAGGVDTDAPKGDLESRLKSEDLAVRRAANKERFEKRLAGEIS